jgi:hypothetical protein
MLPVSAIRHLLLYRELLINIYGIYTTVTQLVKIITERGEQCPEYLHLAEYSKVG